MEVSDNEIRSDIRSLMARHRIDMQRMQVRITNGVVRMTGELLYHSGYAFLMVPSSAIESFEQDLRTVRGIKRTYIDLSNWRQLPSGQWKQVLRPGERLAQTAS